MKGRVEPADYDHYLIFKPRSRFVFIRDILLILLGWVIVFLMLTDIWLVLVDYLNDPIFDFLPGEKPDWNSIWDRLSIFIYVSTTLIISVLYSCVKRYQIIRHEHHIYTESEQKVAQRIAQESFRLGGMAHMDWHAMIDADVHFDAKGEVVLVTERLSGKAPQKSGISVATHL